MSEKAKVRKEQKEILRNAESAAWKKVDLAKKSFRIPYVNESEETASTTVTNPVTAFDLFTLFLPENLLRQIWDSYPEDHWHQGRDGMILHD